jgi:hypothetical protein
MLTFLNNKTDFVTALQLQTLKIRLLKLSITVRETADCRPINGIT